METKKLKVSEVKENPNNPRFIKDDKFQKLVNSIKEFPEMADVREIVVNTDYVILGGNMRFKAMKEAGWKEIPVRVVDWPEDKQREFVIKDNVSGGDWDWDALANQFEFAELDAWGLDIPEGDSDKEKIPTIKITFKDVESLEAAMFEISELANKYGGELKIS